MFFTNDTNTKKLVVLNIALILFSLFASRTNMMILWLVLIGFLSLYFLLKLKNQIRKSDIIISLILGIITMISHPLLAIFVSLAYLSAQVMMSNHPSKMVLYHSKKKYELYKTLFFIFIIGGLLACINLLLAMNSYSLHISFQLNFLFDALRAGIFEEVFFRMFLYALCLQITHNIHFNRIQTILSYLIMVLPHVLMHNYPMDIMSIIILSLIFGLPFAFMSREINLLSAIGSHSFVDLIRFIGLGI